MSNRARIIGLMLLGLLFAFALTIAPTGSTVQAQTPGCDTSGTVDGTASPAVVPPNTEVSFTATNFTAGEEVSFWFTLPSGGVFGTASPLCCAAGDGTVQFQPTTLPEAFYQTPGRWALTVQGSQSNHASVIYFCLVTSVQPTAPAATDTALPPTAAPTDTATSVPATVEATATATSAAASPTAEASVTAEATATGAASSPTVEATATTAVESPTVEPTATLAFPTPVPVATLPEFPSPVVVQPTIEATPVSVGMPRTGSGGSSDAMLYVLAAFMGVAMLALGVLARKSVLDRK